MITLVKRFTMSATVHRWFFIIAPILWAAATVAYDKFQSVGLDWQSILTAAGAVIVAGVVNVYRAASERYVQTTGAPSPTGGSSAPATIATDRDPRIPPGV